MNEDEVTGPRDWRDRPPLSGTEVTDLLALRCVCGHPDSRVGQLGGHYMEKERPVLPFLADGLAVLIEAGHVALGEPDPTASCAMRPLLVTAHGRARYEHLCDLQGILILRRVELMTSSRSVHDVRQREVESLHFIVGRKSIL